MAALPDDVTALPDDVAALPDDVAALPDDVTALPDMGFEKYPSGPLSLLNMFANLSGGKAL